MKTPLSLIIVLFFVFFQKAFAQDPILFEGTWVLESLTIDGEEFFPPSNDEVESIGLDFQEENAESPYFFNTYVCNGFSGNVTYEDGGNSFSIAEYSMTLIFCDLIENELFENQYFTFYLNNIEDSFEYDITFLGDNVTLEIYDLNGNLAFYSNPSLSIHDFKRPTFSIYPNPTSDQLYIDSDQYIGGYTVTIFDIQGKQLLSTSKDILGTLPIAIQDWKTGIYLIKIEDESGRVTAKQFIKK